MRYKLMFDTEWNDYCIYDSSSRKRTCWHDDIKTSVQDLLIENFSDEENFVYLFDIEVEVLVQFDSIEEFEQKYPELLI